MNLDVPWAGCIEERETVKANDNNPFDDWSPIQESALDMNIELTPTSDIRTKWGPYLPGTVWERYIINTDSDGVQTLTNTRTLADVTINPTTSIMLPRPQTNCPSPARLVQAWQPTEFSNYLNAINPNGFTYHDIGLLWGARLLSPTGIFSTLNRSGNLNIERHMVFMTDGETAAWEYDYSAYGVNWYDRRQTQAGVPPNQAMLNRIVDARTEALCTAIKDRNITLWVISYGRLEAATTDRLRNCATRGKFVQADTVSSLISNFKRIAAEISALRITR
jgi:hypothetical protein